MRLDKKQVRTVVLIITLCLSLLIVFKLGSVGLAAQRLYSDYKTIRGLIAKGVSVETLVTLDQPLHDVSTHFDTLYKRTYGLSKLGRLLGWVPKYGATLKQTPQLLDLGKTALEMGVDVYDLTLPVLRNAPPETVLLTLIPDLTSTLSEQQDHLVAQLNNAQDDLEGLDITSLHPRLAQPLSTVKTMLPLAQACIRVLPNITDLAGYGDEPEDQRVYMILALNEDELRPGGGFISSIGEVAIRNANVVSVDFNDSYLVDNYKEPYPLAPSALEQFMGLQLWVFRDSNWSPDFPTSVNQALQVYYPKSGRRDIHGVVSIDQHAVQALVTPFGEIILPEQAEAVTGDTVIDYMRGAYEPGDEEIDGDWWLQRKSFVADIADVMMRRVMKGDVDWLKLGETLITLLNEHHIQVYLLDADVDQVLEAYGWNGNLRVPEGDYLMIAEANLGYNKSSQLIDRSITYSVDLSGETPVSRLELSYSHSSPREIACVPESVYEATYTEMMNRCAWLYLQAFVPEGASLVNYSEHPLAEDDVITGQTWSGVPVVREPTEIEGTTAFEQALLLPTNAQDSVMLEYNLPVDIIQHKDGQVIYRLALQKQAGLDSIPVKIFLHLPENAVLLSENSNWRNIETGLWSIETELKNDIQLEAIYTLDEG